MAALVLVEQAAKDRRRVKVGPESDWSMYNPKHFSIALTSTYSQYFHQFPQVHKCAYCQSFHSPRWGDTLKAVPDETLQGVLKSVSLPSLNLIVYCCCIESGKMSEALAPGA